MPRHRGVKGQRGSEGESASETSDAEELDDERLAHDPDDTPVFAGKGGGGGKRQKGRSKGGRQQTPPPESPPSASRSAKGGEKGDRTPPATTAVLASKEEGAPGSASSIDVGTPSSRPLEKIPLITSERVYHRIMHDILPAKDFDIGYEDRFVGIKYISVEKFRNTGDETSEIPFHRVHYFRYKGKVVWDRANRINLIPQLYEEAANTSGTPSLANVPQQTMLSVVPPTGLPKVSSTASISDTASPVRRSSTPPPLPSSTSAPPAPTASTQGADKPPAVRVFPHIESVFDTALLAESSVGERAALALAAGRQVVLATFNILFDLFDAPKLFTEKRIPAICAELENVDADIIALQEVTGPLYKAIRAASKTLCERYYWTELPPDVRSAQVILSKAPIVEAVSGRMSQQKRCIYAVTSIADCPVVVAAVHLLSDHGGEASVGRRTHELKLISDVLSPHPLAIMLGDFNFGDANAVETAVIESLPFVDAFLAMNQVPPGVRVPEMQQRLSDEGKYFTFDMLRNSLARITSLPEAVPRRLDRILVRGLTPRRYSLFATQPLRSVSVPAPAGVDPSTFALFPSDHFGVVATFDLGGGAPEGSEGISPGLTPASAWEQALLPSTPAGYESSTAMALRYGKIMKKSHGTALVVVLPPELHAAVDRYREQHDKGYPRWMPHITLLFPFVGPSHFPEAIEIIEKALSEAAMKPFTVALRRIQNFNNRKPVVFLEPFTGDAQPLHQLHALLQPLFPKCGRESNLDDVWEAASPGVDRPSPPPAGATGPYFSDSGYHPHVTIGQVEARMVQHFKDTVQSQWEPVEFTVSGIDLIAKLNEEEKYRLIHHFPFAPQRTPSAALARSPGDDVTGTDFSEDADRDLPPLVLEDPKYGRHPLPQYVPRDPLERWMRRVSDASLARTDPTHISQRGAMYHIPNTLIDTYLQRWLESVQLATEVNFFMEEIRGPVFRLYVDLDIKRTVPAPWVGDDLLRTIVKFTERVFAHARTTAEAASSKALGTSPTSSPPVVKPKISCVGECLTTESVMALMQREEESFDPRPSQVCDATALVTQCHTEARDGNDASVVFKSGYRLYFQRIFVSALTYSRYLRLLLLYLKRTTPLPEHLPASLSWEDVCDAKAADWDRARLYGTVKRRNQFKDVQRIYSLHRVIVPQGTMSLRGAADDAVRAAEDEATATMTNHPLCLLYAQVVRLWAGPPQDAKIQSCDNAFIPERLFLLQERETQSPPPEPTLVVTEASPK